MPPKHNQKQKQKATSGPSPTQGDPYPLTDLGEYGPIFFHNENEDYGFMSNFYETAFSAPHPATWLFEQSETTSSASAGGNAHAGDEGLGTVAFRHSEQYYMYCKAIYFGDEDAARKIISTANATQCKAAGRSVRGFSDKAWDKHDLKVRVMEEGLWWKFGGGQLEADLDVFDGGSTGKGLGTKEDRYKALGDLGRQLLATEERQLVEAAGQDRYWGIGYRMKDGPHLWQDKWGRNQLGKSLMAVRERLRVLVDGEEDDAQAE